MAWLAVSLVLAGAQVLEIDASLAALSSLALPAAAQSTQVAVASNRAYLLDGRANQLEAIELAPLLAPMGAGRRQPAGHQRPTRLREQHWLSPGAGRQRQRIGDQYHQVPASGRESGPGPVNRSVAGLGTGPGLQPGEDPWWSASHDCAGEPSVRSASVRSFSVRSVFVQPPHQSPVQCA
jgi:hypothetical protein